MANQGKGRPLNGILILDKPTGMTSNFALQKVKRLFGARKAGHTGALDPLATGLLPICFGEATKFTQFLLEANKRYQTTAQLGVRTNTSDADGKVIDQQPYNHINQESLATALQNFRGQISQVPSMYSALKHQGQPLYRLARAGKQVEVKTRQVTIYDLTLLEFNLPNVRLDIACSKGTYIRTIVEDLGLALGCGAHVTQLRRLEAGPFQADQMVGFAQLETLLVEPQDDSQDNPPINRNFAALDALLLPSDTAVLHLNAVQLPPQQTQALQQGKLVNLQGQPDTPKLVRVYGANQEFIGLANIAADGTLRAKRLLQTQT